MNQIQHVNRLGFLAGLVASLSLAPLVNAQSEESGLLPRLVIEEVSPAIVQPVGGDIRVLSTGASPAGLVGDQVKASISSSGLNGFVVWHDNAIDGDGTGIGCRYVNLQTGASSPNIVRVNQYVTGNQENPRVAVFSNGSAVIVWQSGQPGQQSVVGRLMSRTGAPVGDEFVIATPSNGAGHARPAIAVVPAGGFVVAWEASGADGVSRKIHVQQFDVSAATVGAVRILGTAADVDRSAAISVHADGKIVVAWVAENATANILDLGGVDTRKDANSDIFAQTITAGGVVGAPVWINSGAAPCDGPALAALPNGKTLVGWSEFDTEGASGWDIKYTMVSASDVVLSSSTVLNTYRPFEQNRLSFATSATDCLAVWSSRGSDGAGLGVAGRSLTFDGTPLGDEIVFNSTKRFDQIDPGVAVTPNGYRVVWSSLTGIATGVDLAGRDVRKVSAPGNRALRLRWNAMVGFRYVLESSTNLVDWQVSQTFSDATSLQQSVTLNSGAAANTYFRVKLDR